MSKQFMKLPAMRVVGCAVLAAVAIASGAGAAAPPAPAGNKPDVTLGSTPER
jgi:hypothetical protein